MILTHTRLPGLPQATSCRSDFLSPNAKREITARAQHLVSAGSAIPALQALLIVRRLGAQSIAALLGDCLSATILQAAQPHQATLSRLA